jgi:hypothetical protein
MHAGSEDGPGSRPLSFFMGLRIKSIANDGLLRVLAPASVILLLGAAFAWPVAFANACPACLGFKALSSRTYIEETATKDQQATALATVDEARSRVDRFYGGLRSHPRIFICQSENCYGRIGGRSRGLALFDWALFLSPRGTTTTIASHEMSHIELHARLGFFKTLRRAVPQWFDEGVAVLVSNDPRYLRSTVTDDRCLIQPDGRLPASRQAWIETAASASLYAKAACRVYRWTAANGGPSAVVALLNKMEATANFEVAYRSPRS